ncbi:hypothetical protein [Mammaliicoccus vitulinus]|uniref:hypothetical protein n=1 Tax=Mammaliicoccus vitulinus TaxID=71237 RepID=UPI00248BF185|nr:hypothetical protein [Mammaliicoccus vitulinus]
MKNQIMSKKAFWIRLVCYSLFGLACPIIFLAWRFKLFTNKEIALSGWGVIAIMFVTLFFLKLINTVRKSLQFSIYKQILDGICKVIIPLTIAAICVYCFQNIMKEMFEFLCVLIVCEMIAICLNPLPQWKHDHNIQESENTLKKALETLGLIKEKK